MLITFKNTFTGTSRLVCDLASVHHSLAKLTHKINFHSDMQLIGYIAILFVCVLSAMLHMYDFSNESVFLIGIDLHI